MKCDRCKKDHSYFEMNTASYNLMGALGKRRKIKRTVCDDCDKVYSRLHDQSLEIAQEPLSTQERAELEELGRILFYEGRYSKKRLERFEELNARDLYERECKA